MDRDDHYDDYDHEQHASNSAPMTSNKRSREGNKRNVRRSIFRVNSRADRGEDKAVFDVPNSPRARASTYSHVHDAVMYNLSEAEISKHDQTVPMGVIGLKNLGNTCFINSSLQCLSATIPLTDYFLGYDYRSEINQDNFLGTGGTLVVSYAELMKQMWLGSRSVAEPSDFKQQLATFAPQFSGYHQHDSQELLSFLLDGIHEDLNRVKERPYVEDKDCDGTKDEEEAIEAWKNYLRRNKSLVVDLFQGQLRNTCKCLTCGHKNIRFEPFMYLSLPISEKAKSLDDCINLYLEEETLKGADQWYCEKCKKHVDATKKIDLWILPPILIVHLKRFLYNDYGKVGRKNDQSINYPVHQWDLKSRVRSTRGTYPMYDLYAVSNHVGGLGGGHYTAVSLNRFDDLWYEFNDSSYRSVDESIHEHHSKSSYVLFYNRSEGDMGVPLNERSPIIRRQSVSRPDLWPHTQMDDRSQVRNFTRSSRMPPLGGPGWMPERNNTNDSSGSNTRKPAAVASGIPHATANYNSPEKPPASEALSKQRTHPYPTRSKTSSDAKVFSNNTPNAKASSERKPQDLSRRGIGRFKRQERPAQNGEAKPKGDSIRTV
jgi:ubiquitin carboxyl-terminal hydrolase 8